MRIFDWSLGFGLPGTIHPRSRRRGRRLKYEHRLLLSSWLAGLPGTALALLLLWTGEFSFKVQLTLTLFLVAVWWGVPFGIRNQVVYPLQILSNLLAALREGDYSIRGCAARKDDALGEVMREVNDLGAILKDQRLGALEASALLRTVMAEIQVSVFAFDGQQKLRLVNRPGSRLLGQPAERLLGRSATELGLAGCLDNASDAPRPMTFPGGSGRWEIRRGTFREGGLPHQLLVLTDVSRALREEERLAWQRLVRVLGHELNNSLAPIKSLAGSMVHLINREPRPADWKEDMQSGLSVIAGRAESLSRFMEAYTRVARLPQPTLRPVQVGDCLCRAAGLETRLKVQLIPGPERTLQADGDQLEQALINLIKNATDASLSSRSSQPPTLETKDSPGVQVTWTISSAWLEIWVLDDGPGLSNTTNLFVPFFTTKPGGSGIGLVLSRQIAEAHGGTLTLENRPNARGCEARLRLPLR